MTDMVRIVEMNGQQDWMPALAMAYVPNQVWNEVYALDIGLCRGTIFPCLDKPFIGKECVKNGRK